MYNSVIVNISSIKIGDMKPIVITKINVVHGMEQNYLIQNNVVHCMHMSDKTIFAQLHALSCEARCTA